MRLSLLISYFFFLSFFLSAQEFDTRYTVYYFLGEDCKICQYYSPTINALDTIYTSDSLSFVGLFPNRYSTEKGISAFQEKHKIGFELKREYFGTKTKQFGVTITPEVVVYDNHEEKVLYKGRIDDSYHKLGRRRQVITSEELKDVLAAIVGGMEITTLPTPSIGCYITFR